VWVLKFPKLRLLKLWGPITLCVDLWLRWSLKQSCCPCWELFKNMWHATFMQVNRVDSQLLMVGSQTDNLTLDPSFHHNLCFNCPNGSCEPISDIYVLRYFQWYRELLNPMGFFPYNFSLKVQESVGTPTPKMGAHLGMWGFIPSHSPTLPEAWDVIPRLPFWPTPLQAFAFVTSPRLGLQQPSPMCNMQEVDQHCILTIRKLTNR